MQNSILVGSGHVLYGYKLSFICRSIDMTCHPNGDDPATEGGVAVHCCAVYVWYLHFSSVPKGDQPLADPDHGHPHTLSPLPYVSLFSGSGGFQVLMITGSNVMGLSLGRQP